MLLKERSLAVMDEREILAKNIAELRIKAGLTQLAFAEELNYSDKAVSKWERGESAPDVFILKRIASFFGVSVDYLLEEKHECVITLPEIERKRRQHRFISLIAIVGVWVLATIYFVIHSLSLASSSLPAFMAFIYAIPVSLTVALVFNSVWGVRKYNYLIISVLIYGIILAVHLTLYTVLGVSLWQLYIIGVPALVVVILTSRLTRLFIGGSKND